MKVARLSEAQNAAFDAEYHSAAEMAAKLAFVRCRWPGEIDILDMGGGNGAFSDSLLEGLPHARVTNLDVSGLLIARNRSHPRKRLVVGSIEDADQLLEGWSFDLICFNWVLHHLVGDSYQATRANVIQALRLSASLLKPGGMICIAETRFQGWLWSPGWLVYQITRVRQPAFVALASRYFNTAGVGVCFRSEDEWSDLFADAGLEERHAFYGDVWPWRWQFAGLGLAEQQAKHTFLGEAA